MLSYYAAIFHHSAINFVKTALVSLSLTLKHSNLNLIIASEQVYNSMDLIQEGDWCQVGISSKFYKSCCKKLHQVQKCCGWLWSLWS